MQTQIRQIATAFERLALFWRASQWLAAKNLGLNPSQSDVLQRISRQPERATDLAARLGVTQASLSDTVSALVAKGLAERQPDPADGRARRIEATGEGRTLAACLPEAPEPLEAAITGLGEADRGGLLRSLSLIIRSLQEAEAIPVQQMCLTCRHFRPHVHADPAQPHHCGFVDAAFGDGGLRLDCADHETATEEEAARNRARLAAVW